MGSEGTNMTLLQFFELNTCLFSNLATDGVFGLLSFVYESARITPTGIGTQYMI